MPMLAQPLFLAALIALGSASSGLHAQPEKIQRIGVLLATTEAASGHLLQAFQGGMRELGYVDGRNIRYEVRYAENKPEKLDQDAREFVRSGVALIHAPTTQAARAAIRATSSIPVVFANVGDPVGSGLVKSLAAPGGNATGIGSLVTILAAKRLELLRELVPNMKRVGYLHDPSGTVGPGSRPVVEDAARALGIELLVVEVRTSDAWPDAFSKLKERRAEALMVDGLSFFQNRKKVIELAAASRLPSIDFAKEWTLEGGLISYGIDIADAFRRSAAYVDRILKGTKPAQLPVQQPTKFELVVNLKAAKALGITVPQSILLRADQVIE